MSTNTQCLHRWAKAGTIEETSSRIIFTYCGQFDTSGATYSYPSVYITKEDLNRILAKNESLEWKEIEARESCNLL